MLSTGKHSNIKCKSEAHAPKLIQYVQQLKLLMSFLGKSSQHIHVEIITDDVKIQQEIQQTPVTGIEFLEPEPAPKRIPDKVSFLSVRNIMKSIEYFLERIWWNIQG